MRHLLPLLLLVALAAPARAEWSVSAGPDHFDWTEKTSPIAIHESGSIYSFELGVRQRRSAPFGLGYRGRLYGGQVDYRGSSLADPDVPVNSSTSYLGTEQEGQLRARMNGALDLLGGLDLDLWRRDLGASQREDYQIVSVRVGGELAPPKQPWSLAAGFKWSLSADENAHFDRLGFTRNPALTPGPSATPYVRIDYLMGRDWSVVGSLDGFAFGRSNEVLLAKHHEDAVLSFQPASRMQLLGLRITYGR